MYIGGLRRLGCGIRPGLRTGLEEADPPCWVRDQAADPVSCLVSLSGKSLRDIDNGGFTGGLVLKNPCFHCRGAGSIPG